MVRRQRGGVYQKQRGGCPTPLGVFFLSLFGFFVLDRTPRTAPAERERTGATPPFSPLARFGKWGGVPPSVPPGVPSPPAVGEVAPVCRYPCWKAPRPACGPDDQQRRAARCLTDSSARSWSSAASVSGAPGRGPARFPRPIPWRCSSATTSLYRAAVAWYDVASGVAVFLAGQFLIPRWSRVYVASINRSSTSSAVACSRSPSRNFWRRGNFSTARWLTWLPSAYREISCLSLSLSPGKETPTNLAVRSRCVLLRPGLAERRYMWPYSNRYTFRI